MLTVLAGAPGILIVSSLSTLGHGDRIVPTAGELAAAERRDEARRAEWAKYRIDVDSRIAQAIRAKAVLIVSASAAIHASVLRAGSAAPLTTYGVRDAAQALDALAVHALPSVIVLDRDLPGADELATRIREEYPLRFGAFDRVQWLSSKRGLRPEDTERILKALGTRFVPSRTDEGPFVGLSILVVDDVEPVAADELLRALER